MSAEQLNKDKQGSLNNFLQLQVWILSILTFNLNTHVVKWTHAEASLLLYTPYKQAVQHRTNASHDTLCTSYTFVDSF